MSVTAVIVMNSIRQLLIASGIIFVLETIGVVSLDNISSLYVLPLFLFLHFVSEFVNRVPLRSSIM